MKINNQSKKASRIRRREKSRHHIRRLGVARMSVEKTLQHIYVQVTDVNANVICSASSLDKEIASQLAFGGNCSAAKQVGALIGQRCLEKNISKVAFDRSGFKFHGRIKALADAARDAGMEF